jgi:spermidine synthase
MLLHREPRRVLILGGGEGATLREVLKYRSVEEAVMVDIDEEMIRVARVYLKEWHQGAFDDPRARIVIDDAWNYVKEAVKRGEKFDVVISDLVDPEPGGPATRLYTKEFYSMVKSIMAEGGVFVTQATSLSYTIHVHASIRKTVAAVFGSERTASYGVYVPSFDSYWGFVVASLSEEPGKLLERGFFEERLRRAAVASQLRFLDYDTMVHMMTLPRPYREGIEREGRISTLENPVVMPA